MFIWVVGFVVGFSGDCPLGPELEGLCPSACNCLWVVRVYFWVRVLVFGFSAWMCFCVDSCLCERVCVSQPGCPQFWVWSVSSCV